MADSISNPLNSLERSTLRTCEKAIEKGCKTFLEVGNALMQIKNESLHRETHKSFATYCEDRFGFTRQRAYQLIEGAEISQKVSTRVDTSSPDSQEGPPVTQIPTPTGEYQIRSLAKLPEERQADAWAEAVAAAGGQQPAPAQVQEVVEAYLADDEEPEEEPDEPLPEEPEEKEESVEDVVDQYNRAIESFCRNLMKAAKDRPDLDRLDHKGRWDGYLRKIKQGLDTLRSAKAVVCPACKGKAEGCDECEEYGYLPKVEAESISA